MDLKGILKSIKKESPAAKNSRVLLIDGTNTFIRGFAMVKTINQQGHHVGGLVGFLKSLGYMIRILKPTRVICIFDGKGASINRKQIDPNYKANRKLKQITSWGVFNSLEQEQEAITNQLGRLMNYLECLPVQVLEVEKVEADDIIAILAKKLSKSNKKVIIASSDKDFMQLVDDNVTVYSPIKRETYTPDKVLRDMGVIPKNYIYVKTLLGDDSDNLPGVKGLGLKTLLKEFPDIIDDESFDYQRIYDICEKKMKDKAIFPKIINSWDRVELNHKLMDLSDIQLADWEMGQIVEVLKQPIKELKSGPFSYYMEVDGVEGITSNTDQWLQEYRYLSYMK